MKILKTVLIAIAGLAALLLLIGFLLPGKYQVTRSIDVNAPMIKVYPLVYDPKAWARWGVWNQRDPAMKMTYSGAPAGVGAKWAWESKSQGNGSMELTRAEFDKVIAYKTTFSDYDGVFDGRLEFAPIASGVRVTWIAEGDVGANPLMHYFAMLMDRMLGPDFEAGLKNLKTLAEQP